MAMRRIDMLKLKDGFIMREIGGDTMVLPSGDELDLNMMITLNDTGKFLWVRLQEGTTMEALVADVLKEYDAEEAEVKLQVEKFVGKLNENGFLI